MAASTIEQFHRGKLFRDNQEASDFIITARSRGLSTEQAAEYFTAVDLGSASDVNSLDKLQHGFGMHTFRDDVLILSHLRPGPLRVRGHLITDYRCLVVPRPLLVGLDGDPSTLFALFDRQTPPILGPSPAVLEPLSVSTRPTSSMAERLKPVLDFDPAGKLVGQLLSALINGQAIAIVEYDTDPERRLGLAIGLRLLLPPAVRVGVTFATEVLQGRRCRAQLKFLYADPYTKPGEGDVVLWADERRLTPAVPSHPYAELLLKEWGGGATTVAAVVAQGNDDAVRLLNQGLSQDAALRGVVGRLTLDREIAAGRANPGALAQVLRQSGGLPKSQLERYARDLFVLALDSGEVKLTRAIAEKGLAATLQSWMIETMRARATDWMGLRVYQLALEWCYDPAGYGIRLSSPIALLNEVIDSYLGYLSRTQPPGKAVAFLENAQHDLEPLGAQAITASRLRLIRAIVPDDNQATLHLLELTALYDRENLGAVLKDEALRGSWPAPLQKVVAALVSSRENRSVDLVAAAQAVPDAYFNLFIYLVEAATDSTRAIYLMRAPVWRELRLLLSEHPAIDTWLFPRIGQFENRFWVNTLAAEDVAALAEYLAAGGHYYAAVAILNELCLDPLSGEVKDTQPLTAFFTSEWNDGQTGSCVELTRAIKESRLPAAARAVAYEGLLQRTQWQCDEARAALLQLAGNNHAPPLNDATSLRLILPTAGQKSMGQETQRLLGQRVQSAFGEKTMRQCAGSLSRVAETINQQPQTTALAQTRAYMTTLFRASAQQLPPEQLKILLNELQRLPGLAPELAAARAMQLARQLLGSGGIAAFQTELTGANRLLERLQRLFEPGATQNGRSFDWSALEGELLAQSADAKQLNELAAQCRALAQRIETLEANRTRTRMRQDKTEQEIMEGKREPAGALDALLRLAGVFQRRR